MKLMEYRKLGKSGLKVSEISLGGWATYGFSVNDQQMVRDIVQTAYDGGVNFFDQADIYAKGKSEEMMGDVLRDFERHSYVISSKVFWPMWDHPNGRGLSRKHILESCDASLKRMKLEYFDLYFAHRYDPEVPLEEIVRAFDHLVRSGRVLYWGTSEWSGAEIRAATEFAQANGLYAPVVEQPQYSMLYRQRVESEILPTTTDLGMGLVVWSPLAMGMLTGKFDEGFAPGARLTDTQIGRDLASEENRAKVQAMKSIADDLGITRSQLALAWILRNPGVSSAIVGATKVAQLEESLKGTGITLEESVLAQLEGILKS
jgi:voltage-dependent potassium channel beta subunit